jgi:pimeloyl-ACP methyl ester carboxylesterase
VTEIVRAADGRRLSVDLSGNPDGVPVFLLHGTPGSRLGPRPRGMLLYRLGVRLITFDRPGYGQSDRRPGRRVADVAADVAAIADRYGIERFAVAGRSGGGPHALACAALLPRRVRRVAILVGLAPHDADGLAWFNGMAPSNRAAYSSGVARQEFLAARLTSQADTIRGDPASLLARLYDELPDADRRVISDPGIRALLEATYAEALHASADGWIDDALALCTNWGFDPTTVAVPVLLWHGERDVFSPVSHTRWLGNAIPRATVVVQSGAAHFGALNVLADVLRWLTGEVYPD